MSLEVTNGLTLFTSSMVIFRIIYEGLPGVSRKKGNKAFFAMGTREQGNKGTKQKGIDLVPRLSSNEERSGKSLGTWLQGNM